MLAVKNLPASAADTRDTSSVPGSGGAPGEGNGNPLWSACLGNPMDRGAWRAAVPGVSELDTTEHSKAEPMLNACPLDIDWNYISILILVN